MKIRLILMAVILFISIAGYSQTSFGLRAGVNFQNLNGKDPDGHTLKNKLKPGFNLGVNAEVPVAPEYYVQPGVLFTTKGAKVENDFGIKGKINISYIEIPINFLYKPALGTGRLLMGLGPYFAFAVGGKAEYNGTKRDVVWKSEITQSEAISGTPYLKRFDAGGNLLFGYEFNNKFSAQLNSQLGLVKINPKLKGSNGNESVKNTGFGVSLGYRF